METKTQRIPVLIIDDELTWCKLVEYNLYLDGFKVYTKPDGPSGIRAAIEHHPRVILLDIMLPKIDGYKVLSILKRDRRTSHIPVIMLSVKNAPEDINHALELGADDYITKPSKPSDLGKIIKAKITEWKKK
jgi:DNA-binding response OmpR family regulator